MDNRNNVYFSLTNKILVWSLLIGFVLIVSAISSKAQIGLIPEKYLKIVPGVSTRADVERLYMKWSNFS